MNKSSLIPHDKSLRKHLPKGAWVLDTEVISFKLSNPSNPRVHGLVRVKYKSLITDKVEYCLVKTFLKQESKDA